MYQSIMYIDFVCSSQVIGDHFTHYKGSFRLQQFCCKQQLTQCIAIFQLFVAMHCASLWSQQNCCDLKEPKS